MKIKSIKFFILPIIFFLPILAYGQVRIDEKIIVHGVVVDSTDKKPLAGAVVSIFLPKDTIHFITNTKGTYNFSLSKQPLFLEAALLGYGISRITTDKKSNLQVYDTISMVQRTFKIDAAVVIARIKKVVYPRRYSSIQCGCIQNISRCQCCCIIG